MSEWQELVAGVGFPIAVSFFLLFYFMKKIDTLAETIGKQTEVLVRLCEKLDDKGGKNGL